MHAFDAPPAIAPAEPVDAEALVRAVEEDVERLSAAHLRFVARRTEREVLISKNTANPELLR